MVVCVYVAMNIVIQLTIHFKTKIATKFRLSNIVEQNLIKDYVQKA